MTDRFGRKHTYLRISVAEKCNLRCVYCMPEEGVQLSPPDAMFSTDEMVRVIQLFSRLGVNKLRFTGGEVRPVDALGAKCVWGWSAYPESLFACGC